MWVYQQCTAVWGLHNVHITVIIEKGGRMSSVQSGGMLLLLRKEDRQFVRRASIVQSECYYILQIIIIIEKGGRTCSVQSRGAREAVEAAQLV